MPERMQKTTPFMEGQNSNDHKGDAPKAPVKFKMAKTRNAGNPDPLVQVLIHPPREFSDTQHFAKRSVHGRGHHYTPDGEFGRPTTGSLGKTKATGMSLHTSRKGENALGRALNRVGQKSGWPSGGRHGGGGGRGA